MDAGRPPGGGVAVPFVLQHVIAVEYAPTEGSLGSALPTLKRRLTVLGRDADLLRVGVTSDVARRAGEHRGYGFDWFMVLWETTSRDRAVEAEAALIEHARWKGLPLAGDRRGGVRGAGPFAVYVAGQ